MEGLGLSEEERRAIRNTAILVLLVLAGAVLLTYWLMGVSPG